MQPIAWTGLSCGTARLKVLAAFNQLLDKLRGVKTDQNQADQDSFSEFSRQSKKSEWQTGKRETLKSVR